MSFGRLIIIAWVLLIARAMTVLAADPATPASPLARAMPRIPPKSPAESQKTVRVMDGFSLELVAAEPLLTDPVAMQYDANGLAYVAEMGDYPYSDKSHDKAWQDQTSLPLGRIRLLEDADGDGRLDRSTVFAEKISWPTGLACWKGGVFVTATPDILYLKDTDGDRVADVRERVFTGFRKYNVQAVINNLEWGLDHQVYGAGSSNGGQIHRPDRPEEKPVNLGRNDFRFHPVSRIFEVQTGGARFGNTFDDWGNRFICNIRNPAQHIVLPGRYLQRNPFLRVRTGLHDVATAGASPIFAASAAEPWRILNAQRVAADPTSAARTDAIHPTGYVTSSSGITVYRGAAYPPAYRGSAFVAEVAGNLVMRYLLHPTGPTFTGERVHGEFEFLTATDNWFRPVNFVNAPDGTLHILDMYRETIEHPWSIPDDIKQHVDLTSGRDRGRIWRLVPDEWAEGFQQPGASRLGSASTEQLVAQLENPNGWWRDTAHRLIFERQDTTAAPPLRRLLAAGDLPQARLHALWSLEGLGVATPADLLRGLADESPRVREHAVRLAESQMKGSPALAAGVVLAADDDDVRVRFRVALALGGSDDPRSAEALVRIARRDAADPWSRTAVLCSINSPAPFLLRLLEDRAFAISSAGQSLVGQLGFIVGAQQQQADVHQVLAAVATFDSPVEGRRVQHDMVMALGEGLRRAGRDLSIFDSDSDLPSHQLVQRTLRDARAHAVDPTAGVPARQAAIRLLGLAGFDTAGETLLGLLTASQPQAVQTAAVEGLSAISHQDLARRLLDAYPQLTPAVRVAVVQALMSRSSRIGPLLEAVADGRVSRRMISPVRRPLLMRSADPQVRKLAEQLFAHEQPGPRKEVIDRYQSALTLEANAARGETVFRRECHNCHRFNGQGHDVGPNLETILHRRPADVLVNILDPNREVSPNHLQYALTTADGRIVTGMIAAETATSITLREAENKEQTVSREEIEQIVSTGKSLMPEGLEQKVTPQDVADLLGYLLQPDPASQK